MSKLTKYLGIDRLVQEKAAQYAKAAQQQFLQIGFNNVVYIGNDTTTLVKRAFENIIFYSVARRIALKAAHIPCYCYKQEAKMKRRKSLDENIVEGELSKLLKRPNEYQGEDQFNYIKFLSYITTGETFIWKNRGGYIGGKPLEMYVIPSWLISPVSDGTLFGVKEYLLEVNGTRIILPKEDVIHVKEPSLSLDASTHEHLRGFNPLIPGSKTLQESDDIQDASVSMFQNGGVRAIVYNETLDALDPQQQSKLKSVVDGKFNNKLVKSSVAAIQGKWGLLDLSKGAVDMQLIEAEEAVVKKICFLLGFPVELYTGDATHANREQSLRFLLTQTIAPLCATFDSEFNRGLVPDFKESGFVACDMSELPEMQAMRLEMAKAYQTMWELTPNQRLINMGFEPNPNPAMDIVYMPNNFIPIDEATVGQGMDNADTQDYNA